MLEIEPLFDIEAPPPFGTGQRVVAHTIWGDEPGKVTALLEAGWVKVHLDRGSVLQVSTTRLAHEEDVR